MFEFKKKESISMPIVEVFEVLTEAVFKSGVIKSYKDSAASKEDAEKIQFQRTKEMLEAMQNNKTILVDWNLIIRGEDVSFHITEVKTRLIIKGRGNL